MTKREHPIVNEELVEELKKAFDYTYVIKREDMTAEEKIGYIKGVQEITNLLHTWSED